MCEKFQEIFILLWQYILAVQMVVEGESFICKGMMCKEGGGGKVRVKKGGGRVETCFSYKSHHIDALQGFGVNFISFSILEVIFIYKVVPAG